jgi:hypothetical protein
MFQKNSSISLIDFYQTFLIKKASGMFQKNPSISLIDFYQTFLIKKLPECSRKILQLA